MLMTLMYINQWRGPGLDSPLSQMIYPSPLTKCLDILQYDASLPTGMLSIYICITLSEKTQISSQFLCWKETGKSNKISKYYKKIVHLKFDSFFPSTFWWHYLLISFNLSTWLNIITPFMFIFQWDFSHLTIKKKHTVVHLIRWLIWMMENTGTTAHTSNAALAIPANAINSKVR